MQKCQVSLLQSYHDRSSFSCEIKELDDYLKRHASQDVRRYATAVYILTEAESHTVQGFYTLSARHILASDFNRTLLEKLPHYPLLPVTLLGRLALDQTCKGRGLGGFLLMDALRRSLHLSASIGSVGVIVDAKNSEACSFYQHHGFESFPTQEYKLFISMTAISRFIFST